MRSKDTKRTYVIYLPYECSAIEEYLEEMAEKGWLLQSTKRGFFKFKKIEARKIKYSVDVLDRISVFDHNDSDIALEYREYCEKAGSTYICEDGATQIFYTDSDSEIVSIHTDEGEKFKVVYKSSIKIIYTQMILIILFIISMYLQLTDNTEALASNIGIFTLGLLFSIILMNCIQVINFYIWVVKAKGQLKINQQMPYNSYKQLKKKSILIRTYNIILIIIFLISLILDSTGSRKLNIPLALIMLIPIIILSNVKKFTDKKDYTKASNRGIYIGSAIVLLLVVPNLISAFGTINNDKQSKLPAQKVSLTIMDFGYNKNENKNWHIEFDESILAKRTKYTYDSGYDSFEYTIFESKYPVLIKLQENSLVSRYKKYMKYKREKTSLPSNIRAYVGGISGNFYILASEDKVVFIVKGTNISKDKFLNIVYKKLFQQ
ncbi:DUF2812 domain-containing protein [Clostridium sp.]|uniref:DUF2812 domain-containing protein n=1 Tax=Clostridium sp. TaxID=1506 RepID=UPI003D6C8D81